MNKPICYTLAKLLKEKGFLEDCENEYDGSGKLRFDHTGKSYWVNKRCNDSLNIFSAPTIADVVMWLYEKHKIWIMVNNWYEHVLDNDDNILDKTHLFAWFITGEAEERTFKTPTEAYEVAIEYTLTKLI